MAGVALTPVIVLGATGSIGRQTLEVANHLDLPVLGLAAGTLSEKIIELAYHYPDASVAIAHPPAGTIDAALKHRIAFGPGAVAALARTPHTIVVNGIVGAAGLEPSLAALEAGNRLALANKESLLTGGPIVLETLRASDGDLIPVDSEHSAVWHCLRGERADEVRRVILTASGGPFHASPDVNLRDVSVDDALAHPTWNMGRRISIDSATLMNKAFEVIEAHYLFELDYDQIDVMIHPTSYVHSFVEFVDGVVKAEVGPPDMKKPIQNAMTAPRRVGASVGSPSLAGVELSFSEPDRERFPALDLGYRAGRRGGNGPAILNAADEVAVAAFLEGRIRFTDIATVVEETLETVPAAPVTSLAEALESDAIGRTAAGEAIAARTFR